MKPEEENEEKVEEKPDCRPGESARRAFNEIDAQMPDWLRYD